MSNQISSNVPRQADAAYQMIFQETFEAAALPAGWYTDTAYPKYTQGGWDCKSWDGVIAPLPHNKWAAVRVEFELQAPAPGSTAYCGADGRNGMNIVLGGTLAARHTISDGGNILVESGVHAPLPANQGSITVQYEWTAESMSAWVKGRLIATAPNLRKDARIGQVHVGIRGCVVRRITAWGTPLDEIKQEVFTALKPGFPLEVCVDFNDDLMPTAWTQKTFDALFTELKSWGTSKVSWIDLGREEDHYFDNAPYNTGKNGLQTFKNVGDIFTCAVKTAHAHGMELYGLFKPFDMAIAGYSVPPNHPDANAKNRIRVIGGSQSWAAKMACENRHLVMSRKPDCHGPAINPVWTRIDLVKDDDQPAEISASDVTLYVSDDNDNYQPYTGPVKVSQVVEQYPIYRSTPSGTRPTSSSRAARVIRFEGLTITQPFMAIVVSGKARSFSNRLCDLIHVFGEHGEERRLTYGFIPRNKTTGLKGGFEFNRYPGAPSQAGISGADPIITPIPLDRGAPGYIALAKGKDKGPIAAMSPSFKQTRELWMGWIKAMLDAGADGIDVRLGGHHSDISWIEYGFEEPVRDEMLKRTGVDIWQTDDFDYETWRKIRGEGYTQFLREVSREVRRRGKKMAIHIDNNFDGAPNHGGAMNFVCDWQSWIDERLMDSITGKSLWPGSTLARQVLAAAHAKQIPVNYNPYLNNFFEDKRTINHVGDSPIGCHVPVERHIAWGKAFGYDGFVFYECASALWAGEDETVFFRPNAAPVKEVVRKFFVK